MIKLSHVARTLAIAALCGLLLLGLAGCQSPSDYYIAQGVKYYCVQGNNDKALASFNKAIKLDPKNDRAYYERAEFYKIELDEYELAIVDYSAAIELNPENSNYYFSRGICLLYLEEDALAEADFARYNEMEGPEPGSAADYYSQGLRLLNDDKEQALECFNKAIELLPENGLLNHICYSARGSLYEELKQYDLALADYSKAIDLFPSFDYSYAQRGALYGKMEEYELGIADYDAAIRYDSYPEHPHYFYERGELYQKLGKEDLAQADKKRADALVKILEDSLDW